MIPQTLTSTPLLKNTFLDGTDKCEKEKDYEKSDHKSRVSLKNLKNSKEESIVQWKPKNIKDGFVIVDEAQLTKLIKREPIEKYYELEQEPFATGVFASVRRCQSLESGINYAAKFSSRDRYGEDCSAEIYHEIALLSLCGSAARVIQIHDVFETAHEIIIVMEYAPGGDLQTIIDENLVPFESDVMSFIKQTVEGLEYLHRRRIAHLDIKSLRVVHEASMNDAYGLQWPYFAVVIPSEGNSYESESVHTFFFIPKQPQNIVMMGNYPNCEIKLCDFEISRVILEGTTIRELLGTPDYVAPEILHYDPITLAADMWSLGVTTYVLLTGFSPFGGETDQETFCNISRAEVDFPEDLFKDVSDEAIDFIKALLVKNPRARLTASACLKHPWLTSKHNQSEERSTPIISNKEETKENDIVTNGFSEEEQMPVVPNLQTEKALRKYLSKSREALFDKVVQKHNNNNLRKPTNKNHRFRKTRLCESQISLISKSRERLLGGESGPTPSRSIEKLYGLRSLSKSQEVLNLYKNGGLLASQENLNMVSELIKSRENLFNNNDVERSREKKLMRATTADLGILHQRHKPFRMYSCSSTTSLASLINNTPEDEENEDAVVTVDISREKDSAETKPEIQCEVNREGNDIKPTIIKQIEKLEESRKIERIEDRDKDEPRFTVAQLITAYNKHQELVTKTSLEVTMSTHKKEIKIPPIIPYKGKSSFPTGPTTLRLFIPDIDLVEMPKRNVPKYKICSPDDDKSDSERPKEEFKLSDNNSERYLSLNSIINASEHSPSRKKAEETGKPQIANKRRSKSSSPNSETIKIETSRKGGVSGSLDQITDESVRKRSPTPVHKISTGRRVDRSPSATRKALSVERSPGPQKRTTRALKHDDINKKEPSSQYKIVKIGDKSANPNRKCSGVSYKIEFDSPVVARKFPNRNIPTKGTISSNLKVKENSNRTKK